MKSRTKPLHYIHRDLVGRAGPVRVALVGAGGNGSQMLTGLARMHLALKAVGHHGLTVGLVDPDVVTEANVGRQLFSPADVGQPKAAVLMNRINLYYGLNWTADVGRFDAGDECDLLIGCVDTIAARKDLANADYTYWLDLGNRAKTGQVILGCPGADDAKEYLKALIRAKDNHDARPTWEEWRPLTFFEINPELKRKRIKEDNTPSCSLAGALDHQDLFINQAVTTWALHLLWSLLRNGHVDCNGYYLNLQTGRVIPIPLRHQPVPTLVPHSPVKRKAKHEKSAR